MFVPSLPYSSKIKMTLKRKLSTGIQRLEVPDRGGLSPGRGSFPGAHTWTPHSPPGTKAWPYSEVSG